MPTSTSARDVVLSPGGLYFGSGAHRVRTLLGSCVAIAVWHPWLRVGGMCHFLVPSRGRPPAADNPGLDGRFADEAMQIFAAQMQLVRTRPSEYHAKLFGGGHQFADSAEAGGMDVAQRNCDAALELAERYELQVSGTDLGARGPRQIVMDMSDGTVWVRHSRRPIGGLR